MWRPRPRCATTSTSDNNETFLSLKLPNLQIYNLPNFQTCKLTNLKTNKYSQYSSIKLSVPTFSFHRPTHILQKFRSPEFLQAGLICNLLPFLDKTCSWDLIFLGQEISMLFVFSTFHACSTDKWYPHSWMITVDLSSGPCIAKLFFRDPNSFYLSAWSFFVSLIGILLFLLTTKLRLPERPWIL